ncbi:MAG: hypothetical protein ACTHJT_10235 [Cytophaga sp.]|uniref:hypothetical protein n=1 Tax=Cytophaga sp. TaxID=29535 RepID=UPI003F7E49E6
MYKYLFFSLSALFVFCTSDHTTEQNPKDSAATATVLPENAPQKDSLISVETGPDTNRIAVLKFYKSKWANACLPIPQESILLIHQDSYEEPFYTYLVSEFAAITEKQTTQYYEQQGDESNEEKETEACAWEQQFSNSIIYSSSYCSDTGGGAVTVNTRCRDKKTLIYLVDILYHDQDYMWNSDSSVYANVDEDIPGSTYQIEKNERGYYYVAIY